MKKLMHLSLPFMLAMFSACGASVSYERISPQEQIQEEIANAPTSFEVAFAEDHSAWERAGWFFQKYTASTDVKTERYQDSGSGSEVWLLTNADSGKDLYRYTVKKTPSGSGLAYTVFCRTEAGTREKCDQNARNLARFIKSGTLEVSMLN